MHLPVRIADPWGADHHARPGRRGPVAGRHRSQRRGRIVVGNVGGGSTGLRPHYRERAHTHMTPQRRHAPHAFRCDQARGDRSAGQSPADP
ncbi:hypothetical protein C3492_29595 [Streptomyces sp. Ru62]|nr:hypothetical protein C3492_29595 [Streptomyces sp. Ru62]